MHTISRVFVFLVIGGNKEEKNFDIGMLLRWETPQHRKAQIA